MEELKIRKIYLTQIEAYEVKSVTMSNDLVLHITLGRITLPQSPSNSRTFLLSNDYIKKDNKDYVSHVSISNDLILHVDNKYIKENNIQTGDKDTLKISEVYLKRNNNEKISYISISDNLVLEVDYSRKYYNVITDLTYSNGILTLYFIPSYRINNTNLVTDLNHNNGVLNIEYNRFTNSDDNLNNVISDITFRNGALILETVNDIKTGVY